MEPWNLTLFLPDNLFAHLLFFNIRNFESYRRYRNSSGRAIVTKKNAHIKISAKASLLNKNKSAKKRVAWKTRTVPWNIEIRSFISSNRKFNYLPFLRKNHTLFSFWFRHCPRLFPFDWQTRNNQRLYIIPLEIIILQVRRGGRSTALRGGAITVPKAPKLSVYRVANGGGRFSCECPGEKESESQQITRYLGSHAPRKPANSPEETEPKERERRRGKGDRNNHRDARTFLIYERAYFLGLLHMDIRAKRWHAAWRAEVDARIGRAHRLEL